jgi:hypothetical protein
VPPRWGETFSAKRRKTVREDHGTGRVGEAGIPWFPHPNAALHDWVVGSSFRYRSLLIKPVFCLSF